MISYYKTIQNRLIACNAPEAGCWVSVIDPTAQERKMLIEDFGLDSDFIKSALDEEESSRVERGGYPNADYCGLLLFPEIQKNDTIVFLRRCR